MNFSEWFVAWRGQVTTGGGVALLVDTLGNIVHGSPWQIEAPKLATSVVLIVWPERRGLADTAASLAGTVAPMVVPVIHGVESVVHAFRLGQTLPPGPIAPIPEPGATETVVTVKSKEAP